MVLDRRLMSALTGKTIAVLGDSIAALYDYVSPAVVPLGAKVNRYVRNGRVMADALTTNSGAPLHIYDFASTDIVHLAIGTNDYLRGTPLGTINDAPNTPTFYGYTKQAVEAWLFYKPDVLFVVNTIIWNGNSPTLTPNGIGLTVADYNQALLNLAERYTLVVNDLFTNSGINYSTYNLTLGPGGRVYPPSRTTPLTGTVSISSTGTTVTGVKTTFTKDYLWFDRILANGEEKRIETIVSDTELTVATPYAITASGLQYFKQYYGGDGTHPTLDGYEGMTRACRDLYANLYNLDGASCSGKIKNAGAYADVKSFYVKRAGFFRPARAAFIKHNGLWARFWPGSGSIGSSDWPAGGTYEFIVPYYTTLVVEVAGGGGGNQYNGGGNGKQSRFNSVVPLIGDPGAHGWQEITWWPNWVAIAVDRDGGPGAAYGGDTNITGGAANGVAGPRGGGAGGLARKTWARGDANAPVPGTKISLVVGLGGGGGAGNGWVKASWS